jgi:hypothetical protein
MQIFPVKNIKYWNQEETQNYNHSKIRWLNINKNGATIVQHNFHKKNGIRNKDCLLQPYTNQFDDDYIYICLVGNFHRVMVMMFNATFNNISVISWQSVLLVEETRENHRPASSHRQTLSHNVVSSTHRAARRCHLHTRLFVFFIQAILICSLS